MEKIRDILFPNHANGDNSLTERRLTELFGVSRLPVREALKELQKDRALMDGFDLRKKAPPFLKELMYETQETVYLRILHT